MVISKPLLFQSTEVTQKQWEALMDTVSKEDNSSTVAAELKTLVAQWKPKIGRYEKDDDDCAEDLRNAVAALKVSERIYLTDAKLTKMEELYLYDMPHVRYFASNDY